MRILSNLLIIVLFIISVIVFFFNPIVGIIIFIITAIMLSGHNKSIQHKEMVQLQKDLIIAQQQQTVVLKGGSEEEIKKVGTVTRHTDSTMVKSVKFVSVLATVAIIYVVVAL